MSRLCLVALLAAAPLAPLAAQQVTIAAGPMVGAVEMREAKLWVQTTGPARVRAVYWDSLAPATRLVTDEVQTVKDRAFTAHLVADQVEPGRTYLYEIEVNGRRVPRGYATRFRTQPLWQWRTDPPALRIALGSCTYVNEPPVDRPGTPYGSDPGIFSAIHRDRPDVMLWLGDNTYLREVDWYSWSGILRRWSHTRATPEMQPLLASSANYAIWDDHEYGPNDSDRSFRAKAMTLDAFRLFWANPGYGVPPGYGAEQPSGIATMFQWGDVDLFLLDDRWFRAPNELADPDKPYLGEAQLRWLLDGLIASRAPFKIVAIGGQVLNPATRYEASIQYPRERERLLSAIAAAKIPGVLFVDGDRHHTELSRMPRPGTYPLYDLTVSPLTAGVSKAATDEANPYRVDGTLVMQHNYALLDVDGPRTDRRLTISVRDRNGQELWQRVIRASELR